MYILQRENKGVDVEPLAIFDNQGTLMHSHDYQQGSLPLRQEDTRVLYLSLTTVPDKLLELMGQGLLEGGP